MSHAAAALIACLWLRVLTWQSVLEEVSALPGDQSRYLNILRDTLC